MFSNPNEPKLLSLLDLSILRDQMKILVSPNSLDETVYLEPEYGANDQSLPISLPFPTLPDQQKKEKLVFRLVFKPHSSELWGFNSFKCDDDKIMSVDINEVYKNNTFVSTLMTEQSKMMDDENHTNQSAVL